eukprot:scaffold8162_cov103-Skeletonema_dohrnii-CCMP3373.AAC.3
MAPVPALYLPIVGIECMLLEVILEMVMRLVGMSCCWCVCEMRGVVFVKFAGGRLIGRTR